MTINVLFAVPDLWDDYKELLPAALTRAGVADANVVPMGTDIPPDEIDYLVYAPTSPVQDFSPYTRVKLVQNIWAGVERIVINPTLTQPLARMVDPGLTESMVEWVVGNVLRHHLGLDRFTHNPERKWQIGPPPLARQRPVTILGLGELGTACAAALTALNFPVTGWSRSPKTIAGITCLSGDDGLEKALSNAQILILLLPKTPQTENILNAERIARLPKGAMILNPGRGPLIDDEALIAALDSGHVASATLDVFRIEPLPTDHPYWDRPNVTVTPHIAADTREATAVDVVAENIRRGEAGEPYLFQVDLARGY